MLARVTSNALLIDLKNAFLRGYVLDLEREGEASAKFQNAILIQEFKIMDVAKILSDLRQEREQVEEAILSLERLARGRGKRRGRPPAWLSEVQQVKRRGRPPGSKNKTAAQKPAPPASMTTSAAA
jgi:hypothetical protein